MARLALVCGMPGAGKTSLARRLAERYRAVRMCPDEWLPALGAAREQLQSWERFWQPPTPGERALYDPPEDD